MCSSCGGYHDNCDRQYRSLISLSQHASPQMASLSPNFLRRSEQCSPGINLATSSIARAATSITTYQHSWHRNNPLKMPPSFYAPRKRRREPYNVDVKLVEIYEDLASEKDEIRLKAAQGLVSQFTPDKNPADDQIKKTLQRLFRGLCSSRKAARIGFSIALTEMLTQIFTVKREDSEVVLADALRIWEAQSNNSGETRQVSWAM